MASALQKMQEDTHICNPDPVRMLTTLFSEQICCNNVLSDNSLNL